MTEEVLHLKSIIRWQEIEIARLMTERLRLKTMIELLKAPDLSVKRQYANSEEFVPDDEPLRDQRRVRASGDKDTIHPRTGRVS